LEITYFFAFYLILFSLIDSTRVIRKAKDVKGQGTKGQGQKGEKTQELEKLN